MNNGKKNWYLVDGWMPGKQKISNPEYMGHEAVTILNCNDEDASILVDVFFEDRAPVEDIRITVKAKRVRCLRVDNPDDFGGFKFGRYEQYSIRVKSDIEVVVQFGRMDVTQDNLAYVGVMGYSE